jgi:hypothetical protein
MDSDFFSSWFLYDYRPDVQGNDEGQVEELVVPPDPGAEGTDAARRRPTPRTSAG